MKTGCGGRTGNPAAARASQNDSISAGCTGPFDATRSASPGCHSSPAYVVAFPPASRTNSTPAAQSHGPHRCSQ